VYKKNKRECVLETSVCRVLSDKVVLLAANATLKPKNDAIPRYESRACDLDISHKLRDQKKAPKSALFSLSVIEVE
jgi:hypothetical protein